MRLTLRPFHNLYGQPTTGDCNLIEIHYNALIREWISLPCEYCAERFYEYSYKNRWTLQLHNLFIRFWRMLNNLTSVHCYGFSSFVCIPFQKSSQWTDFLHDICRIKSHLPTALSPFRSLSHICHFSKFKLNEQIATHLCVTICNDYCWRAYFTIHQAKPSILNMCGCNWRMFKQHVNIACVWVVKLLFFCTF